MPTWIVRLRRRSGWRPAWRRAVMRRRPGGALALPGAPCAGGWGQARLGA